MQVEKKYKVAVIDKCPIAFARIVLRINQYTDFRVQIKNPSGEATVLSLNNIDVLLCSFKSPDILAISRVSVFLEYNEFVPLLVYSAGLGQDEQLSLIQLNVKGIIAKEADLELLINALYCMVYDGMFYPDGLVPRAIYQFWLTKAKHWFLNELTYGKMCLEGRLNLIITII